MSQKSFPFSNYDSALHETAGEQPCWVQLRSSVSRPLPGAQAIAVWPGPCWATRYSVCPPDPRLT